MQARTSRARRHRSRSLSSSAPRLIVLGGHLSSSSLKRRTLVLQFAEAEDTRPPLLSSLLSSPMSEESEAEFIERHLAESRGTSAQRPANGLFNIVSFVASASFPGARRLPVPTRQRCPQHLMVSAAGRGGWLWPTAASHRRDTGLIRPRHQMKSRWVRQLHGVRFWPPWCYRRPSCSLAASENSKS